MKKYMLLAMLAMLSVNAQEIEVKWSGSANKITAPKVEKLVDEDWVSYRCIPTADGDWQSMVGTLSPAVDLSKYQGVSFDFKQKAYPGNATCVFYIKTTTGSFYANFPGGSGKDWEHVEIPFDAAKWSKGADFNAQAVRITIYPYQHLNKVGKYLEIANFEFVEKE